MFISETVYPTLEILYSLFELSMLITAIVVFNSETRVFIS